MWAVCLYRDGRVKIDSVDYLRFFFLGCLSFTNVVGFIVAMSYTSAENSAMLQPTIPVFSLVFAALVGQERFTANKFFGVSLFSFMASSYFFMAILMIIILMRRGCLYERSCWLSADV